MTVLPLITDQIGEGYVILITGLVIVFSALVTLALFFNFGLPYMLYIYKIITKGKDKKIAEIKIEADKNFTGEILPLLEQLFICTRVNNMMKRAMY